MLHFKVALWTGRIDFWSRWIILNIWITSLPHRAPVPNNKLRYWCFTILAEHSCPTVFFEDESTPEFMHLDNPMQKQHVQHLKYTFKELSNSRYCNYLDKAYKNSIKLFTLHDQSPHGISHQTLTGTLGYTCQGSWFTVVPIKTTKILFDLMLFLIVRLILSCVFLILPLLFSFFSASPSKVTPLESGFVPLDESSSHFNNQFFIILVIFVIFDLEVILSICVVCLSLDRWFFWILISFIGITLLFEWWFNKIRWRD